MVDVVVGVSWSMYGMEGGEMDAAAVGRQLFLEAQGFLGPVSSGPTSTTAADLFLYDDSSDSGSSYSYTSDQENSCSSKE